MNNVNKAYSLITLYKVLVMTMSLIPHSGGYHIFVDFQSLHCYNSSFQNGPAAAVVPPAGRHHPLGAVHLVVPLRRLVLRRRAAVPLPLRLQEARAEGRH